MATQKDIAEYLNISQQAVSASLGNSRSSARVGIETRRRVLEAAEKLGYVANQLARSLKTGKTHVVGVVMPYCRDPYYSALIDALSMEAMRRKVSLMLQFHLWSAQEEAAALQRLVEAQVDGIFFYPRGQRGSKELPAAVRKGQVPVVAIASKERSGFFHGMVEKDYEEEGYQAAAELLRLGHRRIDLLAPSSTILPQRQRMKGAQHAVRAAGVEAEVRHVHLTPAELAFVDPAAPAPLNVRDALVPLLARHYLDEPERGTAVLVGNEAVAWSLMAEAAERGISLPRELSIVAVGVKDEGRAGPLPLTAVEYDPVEIASVAFEMLHNESGQTYRVVPKLAPRRSVADLAERAPLPASP